MFLVCGHDPPQSSHVGDSYLQRDGRAFSGHDIRRAVALALGAAVAGVRDVHGGGAIRGGVCGVCSMFRGYLGAE